MTGSTTASPLVAPDRRETVLAAVREARDRALRLVAEQRAERRARDAAA